jgi:hypothetical protein
VRTRTRTTPWTARGLSLLLIIALAACGGGEPSPAGGDATVVGSSAGPSGSEGPAADPLTGAPTAPAAVEEVPASPAATLRFHPGHYIALNEGDGQAAMILALRPGVTGVHKRYYWRDLEPSPGQYDFSAIASDLQLLADHGLQLVVMIQDKTFGDVRPTPDYLRDYTVPTSQGGYCAARWSPYVVSRLSALIGKLGERFDAHPNFEGIALQESSIGLTPEVELASGYTPEGYRDALIRLLEEARASLPSAQVFWYMNFLEGNNAYLADIAEAVAPYRIAMGGPDVLPDNASLNRHAYPLYERFQGRMTLFGSIQYVSYRAPHVDSSYATKYWTMQELFDFARIRLHASYLFWTRKLKSDPPDSYNWLDALPVIAGNPNFN